MRDERHDFYGIGHGQRGSGRGRRDYRRGKRKSKEKIADVRHELSTLLACDRRLQGGDFSGNIRRCLKRFRSCCTAHKLAEIEQCIPIRSAKGGSVTIFIEATHSMIPTLPVLNAWV